MGYREIEMRTGMEGSREMGCLSSGMMRVVIQFKFALKLREKAAKVL